MPEQPDGGAPAEGDRSLLDDGKVDGCELCEAARITPWHHEDDVCWVADCEICDVPMVVWRRHGADPPSAAVDHMIGVLEQVGTARFGPEGFSVDRVMRQMPHHFHAHARDPRWWVRRFAGGRQ
jgi:hypothetical protein